MSTKPTAAVTADVYYSTWYLCLSVLADVLAAAGHESR